MEEFKKKTIIKFLKANLNQQEKFEEKQKKLLMELPKIKYEFQLQKFQLQKTELQQKQLKELLIDSLNDSKKP